MKKILGVSLVAVFAAMPMMAGAAVTAVDATANKTVATTSYVQGAYNDLADYINTNVSAVNTNTGAISTLNGDASTAGSVAKSIKDNAASGSFNAETNYTSGTIGHAIKNTSANAISALNAERTQAAGADGLSLSVTETAGKVTAISGSIADETYEAHGSAAQALTDAQTYASEGSHLNAGSVAKAKLADGVQTSLGKADSAVQTVAEGSTNGTIAVDGTDVSVHGLGSAAYVASNTLASAGSASAAQTAAETYIDGKLLTVYTTWKSNTTGTTSLINTPTTYDYTPLISVKGNRENYKSKSGTGANSADTDGLSNGEWEVTWNSYGTAKGTSLCSSTSGTTNQTGTPDETGTGYTTGCWCKLTGFNDTVNNVQYEQSSLWVFDYTASSPSVCADRCASFCSSNVRNTSDFRSGLFGSVQ